MQNKSLLVDFKVNCSITKPGETVRVTGSCAELGNWIPKDGLNLTTCAKDFPMWEGRTLIKIDEGRRPTQIEYKYAIVRESDGQTKQWEPFSGNRIIDIVMIKQAEIEDSFGEKNHVRLEFFQWIPQYQPSPIRHIPMDRTTVYRGADFDDDEEDEKKLSFKGVAALA